MLPGLRKISVLTSLLCIAAIAVFFNSSRNLSVFSLGSHKSSLCSCHKCLTDGDPRFTEINTSSPKPFLSRKTMISEDDFNWWKRIYSERYNFSFYNATVVNIFKTFPPVPDVVEASPDRCRTCAVVGNSGNLKGSHYGPLIDFHDVIIRINRGRTKGFEADVGKRTTHHVMYPESAVPLDNTTHLVLVPFKIKDLLWLLQKFNQGENSAVNSKRMANKDLVMILSPAFMKYVHEIWLSKNGSYPSTGFLTFALSMFICDEVSVFGFGANKDGNWDHYFETLKNKHLRTGAHAGSHEYDVIQQLHKKQKIQFFKGCLTLIGHLYAANHVTAVQCMTCVKATENIQNGMRREVGGERPGWLELTETGVNSMNPWTHLVSTIQAGGGVMFLGIFFLAHFRPFYHQLITA